MEQFSVNDLAAAIKAEDDFGFEMQVLKVLRAIQNTEVQHAGTYLDSVTDKPRQFDFRCTLRDPPGRRRAIFCIECKRLYRDAPLVISGTSRSVEESCHELILSTVVTGKIESSSLRNSRNNTIYPSGTFVGKSLLRLSPDNRETKLERASSALESDIYGRWSQALASAHGPSVGACYGALQDNESSMSTLILPVVVVPDGTLWKMEYDLDGSAKGLPEASDSVHFYVNHVDHIDFTGSRRAFFLTHIHFVTPEGLYQLVSNFVYQGGHWDRWFQRDQ